LAEVCIGRAWEVGWRCLEKDVGIFLNCRKAAAKRHKTGGCGIGYSEETKNRKAGRTMNKQKFCWPRCLLLGIGLVVIGLVTIAVFVPAWVWAVLFGAGLVCYGLSCLMRL
jgi:Flp pilus assembly protein TadB